MSENLPARSPSAAILVVDDEAEILDLLRAVLEDEGYQVLTASSSTAALARIQQNPVALVLTDLMMPQGSGLELARQIRSDPQIAGIPIVLMSAAMPQKVSQLFTRVIHKPFSLDIVLDMVHQLLGH
jgi:CheY-like chemotaxis protein